MKKIKNIILALVVVMFPILAPSLAYAQNPAQSAISQGACDASGQANCSPATATNSLNATITSVINILSLVVGVIAVVMIVVAGFRYITSSGNEQTVATAKRTLLYAIIGLVIVVLSQAIARFVLHETTATATGILYSISGLTVL